MKGLLLKKEELIKLFEKFNSKSLYPLEIIWKVSSPFDDIIRHVTFGNPIIILGISGSCFINPIGAGGNFHAILGMNDDVIIPTTTDKSFGTGNTFYRIYSSGNPVDAREFYSPYAYVFDAGERITLYGKAEAEGSVTFEGCIILHTLSLPMESVLGLAQIGEGE